jgi:hypothetical protein
VEADPGKHKQPFDGAILPDVQKDSPARSFEGSEQTGMIDDNNSEV